MEYLLAPERLETDQLLIRCWRPGDGPALHEAHVSSYDHLAPWMPWANRDQTADECEMLVRRFRAKFLLAEDFVLGFFDPDGRRVLGGSGFHLRHGSLSTGIAEIGMWIRGDAAGAGLGTHALESLLAWGFSAWPWRRLVWKTDVDNLASRRIAEKAGMELEGITRADDVRVDGSPRDTAWYAALRS